MKSVKLNPKYLQYLKYSSVNSLIFDFTPVTNAYRGKNIIITCEHASNELPEGVSWSEEESKIELFRQHWAYDPGAAEVSLELGYEIGCPVVMSRISRLFIDVNRPLTSDSLARAQCDDHLVSFNQEEMLHLEDRIQYYYVPYYMALKKAFTMYNARYIFSLHSFTKSYEGTERKVETGVLDSFNDSLATKCFEFLSNSVYKDYTNKERSILLQKNEPWSGKKGLIYAVDSLISARGVSRDPVDGMMLEFRNDKLTDTQWRTNFISKGLAPFVAELNRIPAAL